jgi:hypothetical protein
MRDDAGFAALERHFSLMRDTKKERRKSKRFELRLAVVFSWRDDEGMVQSGEGWSSNISSRGIFVRTKCAPPLGASVEMNVFLPQPAHDIRAAEIHAKGQVSRIDRDPRAQVSGFAAINRTVLIRESMERGLAEKDRPKWGSESAERGIRTKQDIGLRRL